MNLLDRAIGVISPTLALRRAVSRAAIAQLSTYQAGSRSRQNDDWRASPASADLAIIPDSRLLNARARQLARDNWIVASMVRAARRNIVSDGIVAMPLAYGENGESLDELNAASARRFHRWATDAANDVEGRQSFYEKQSLMVEERYTVGESFLVWSMDDRGVRFQSWDADQLDFTMMSSGENQVRGGIELDADGRPVAYHFYRGNPYDYLLRGNLEKVRIPAGQVLHYFRQERVRQCRGVTPLASVMQSIKDFDRYQQASLWSAIMEACVGIAIKKQQPMGGMGIPQQQGSTMRQIDFTPGMVAELGPGEEVQFLNPTRPGSGNESFTATTLRGIAAGMGMSYGLLARHFDSNYSAARQDMLEDDREWGPEQKLLIRKVLEPMYALWFGYTAAMGGFDDCQQFDRALFAKKPQNLNAVDFIVPPKPWIDPEKEMNARKIAVTQGWTTNEQVVTELGGRYRQTWEKLAKENRLAETLKLDLPQLAGRDEFKRQMLSSFTADGTVADIVANATDIGKLVEETGLPRNAEYQEPYVPVKDEQGNVIDDPGANATETPEPQKEGESARVGQGAITPSRPHALTPSPSPALSPSAARTPNAGPRRMRVMPPGPMEGEPDLDHGGFDNPAWTTSMAADRMG